MIQISLNLFHPIRKADFKFPVQPNLTTMTFIFKNLCWCISSDIKSITHFYFVVSLHKNCNFPTSPGRQSLYFIDILVSSNFQFIQRRFIRFPSDYISQNPLLKQSFFKIHQKKISVKKKVAYISHDRRKTLSSTRQTT